MARGNCFNSLARHDRNGKGEPFLTETITVLNRRLIPAHRALVCDILHYDHRMPSFAHSRTMELAELDEVRQRASRRISWSLLFVKAYGMTDDVVAGIYACALLHVLLLSGVFGGFSTR